MRPHSVPTELTPKPDDREEHTQKGSHMRLLTRGLQAGGGGRGHPRPQGTRAVARRDLASPDLGEHLSGLPSAASQILPEEARWSRDKRSESQVTAAGWGGGVLVHVLPPPPAGCPGTVLALPRLAWRRNP